MRKAKGLKLEKFVRLQFEVLSLGAYYQSPNSEPESEKPKSRTRLYY